MKRSGAKIAGAILFLCLLGFSGYRFWNWQDTGLARVIGTLVVGRAEEVESISGDKYAYQCLSAEEQTVYDQVLNAILEHEEKIVVSTTDDKLLEKVYHCVLADYGGLFWVSGYEYHTYSSAGEVLGIEFLPNYMLAKDERDKVQQQIDGVVAQWLAGVSASDSDYQKSKYIFETLIAQVDYDSHSQENQNIISVFLHQKTVCQGYANAVSYLCEQLELPCIIVTGTADGQPHAWNVVLLDGEYYFLDVTWGNSRYLATEHREEKSVNYGYLNATSEEMSATHVIEMEIPIPECHATRDNYYRQEGLYFDSWTPSAVGNVFGSAWRSGQKHATVKFSNSELYHQAITYFINDHHLADYCPGLSRIGYIQDDNTYVLTLQL